MNSLLGCYCGIFVEVPDFILGLDASYVDQGFSLLFSVLRDKC